jgi:N-alpha-acetyltransferase 40
MSPVTTANKLSLPQFRHTYLPSLPPFLAANGTSYSISLHTATTLPPEDFKACFALIRDTSAEMYKRSTVGWKPVAKRREMRLEEMRYLVVKSVPQTGEGCGNPNNSNEESEEGKRVEASSDASLYSTDGGNVSEGEVVVGFLSFMLTIEDDYPVIYCYEIHLQPYMRGCGLGRHLMGLVEEIGRRVGVDKAMLTVFLRNKDGMKFYERIG